MVSVGQFLKEERERKGVDLAAISQRTKISESMLAAIEGDEIGKIPSAFLYKSFVRQVANELSINFEKIAGAVADKVSEFPAVRVPGEDANPIKVPPIRARRDPAYAWASRIAAFIISVAACSGLYTYSNRIQTSDFTSWIRLASAARNRGEATVTSFLSAINPEANASSRQFANAAVEVSQPVQDPAQSSAPPTESISLRIAALERTWLSIDSDGHHVFSGLLEPAQTKLLEGRDSARLRTGNAGGLTVMFNGRALGALGQRGQVRTVVFTSDDQYEIVQPSLVSRLSLMPAISLTEWMR